MTATYEAIATTTLSSTQATVTFNSFSGYTDLLLVMIGGTTAASGIQIQFNSDTGSNYSRTSVYGFGTGFGSARNSNQTKGEIGGSWSASTVIICNIQNYANTTTNKTVITRYSDPTDTVGAAVTLWRSTSAITSFTLLNDSTTFRSGTTFTLYGIKSEA